MRAENDNQSSTVQRVEVINDPKKPRISYTRETLLSLSQLEICKKLPAGFDTAILSEFEEASNSISERPRIPGSLSSQHFRRGDYGSSPPTRGDSGNYTRGIHGRWDSRSSGSNDRDGNSQSEWDSEFGRRYGNQSRRSWQNSEHDGLLGSGGFPRPSGYTTGALAAKGRGNSHYQLNKSSEPYHPPRPYKAVPHSRHDTTDMYNDETFGSSECSSEDRAEEERRRRASFELFRKEQQKAFPDKQKENVESDILASLVDSEDNKKHGDENNELEARPTILQTDPAKCALPVQTPAFRPLVPPGFTGTLLEKGLGTKPYTPQPEVEQVGSVKHDTVSHGEGNVATNGFSGNHTEKKPALLVDTSEEQCEIKTVHIPVTDVIEKLVIQPSDIKVSGDSIGDASPSYKTSSTSEAFEGPGVVAGFDAERIPGNGNTDTTSQEHSTSILDKLFGAVPLATGCSSDFTECGDVKADDVGGHMPFRSSKFTHWFLEEESKQEDEPSSDQHKDLLSLIVGGEKSGLQASGLSEKELPIFPFKSNELVNKFTTPTTSSASAGTSEPFYLYDNPDATPGVLTCEDLEQSILSGISENRGSPQYSVEDGVVPDAKGEDSVAVDSHASQHLLSLLWKGTTIKGPSLNQESSSGNLCVYEGGIVNDAFNNSNEENTRKVNEKSLTLETLFGSAFMEELQSVEAPVSVHRNSVSGATRTDVSKSQGFSFSAANDGLFPNMGSEYGSNKTSLGNDTRDSSYSQLAKSNRLERHWLRLDTSHTDAGLDLNSVDGIKDKGDGATDIRLPEEESLISVADPVIPHHSIAMPVNNVTNADLLSFSGAPVDIVDKLAALNAALKNESSMCPNVEGPPFLSGMHRVEANMQGWQSSPQFAHLQMNQWRPPFQHLEPHHAHMNPHIKFMAPENIFQPEVHPQHHFPANITLSQSFQNASAGSTRFDPPGHHPMLQQMHVPSNLLPPQVLQGVTRGVPPPPQSANHMGGYPPELGAMQSFPLGQRQRSFGGQEMMIPGMSVGGGNNHPEALEKLIEMQLGAANMKQMHQVAGGAYSQQQQQGGTHGHGIDLGFRYR